MFKTYDNFVFNFSSLLKRGLLKNSLSYFRFHIQILYSKGILFRWSKYPQERELEDLLIDGISGGAVGGKLDQKKRVFEVILYHCVRKISLDFHL